MTDFEMVEAERFSQALDAIEALAEPDLDPREDPTLFSLAALAAELYDAEQTATRSPRFESYRERSRTYVLNRLGARRTAQQVDDSAPREEKPPAGRESAQPAGAKRRPASHSKTLISA